MIVQMISQWWCNRIGSYGRAPDNCDVCAKVITVVVQCYGRAPDNGNVCAKVIAMVVQ